MLPVVVFCGLVLAAAGPPARAAEPVPARYAEALGPEIDRLLAFHTAQGGGKVKVAAVEGLSGQVPAGGDPVAVAGLLRVKGVTVDDPAPWTFHIRCGAKRVADRADPAVVVPGLRVELELVKAGGKPNALSQAEVTGVDEVIRVIGPTVDGRAKTADEVATRVLAAARQPAVVVDGPRVAAVPADPALGPCPYSLELLTDGQPVTPRWPTAGPWPPSRTAVRSPSG